MNKRVQLVFFFLRLPILFSKHRIRQRSQHLQPWFLHHQHFMVSQRHRVINRTVPIHHSKIIYRFHTTPSIVLFIFFTSFIYTMFAYPFITSSLSRSVPIYTTINFIRTVQQISIGRRQGT